MCFDSSHQDFPSEAFSSSPEVGFSDLLRHQKRPFRLEFGIGKSEHGQPRLEWANNAKDSSTTRPSCFPDSQMECCQLVHEVIPSCEFQLLGQMGPIEEPVSIRVNRKKRLQQATLKTTRGRPGGSGWKQPPLLKRLAWMLDGILA